MNKNINLIAFGTFGAPNGFTQTFFLGNPILQKNIKTFDIRGQLLIYPKSSVYSIRKEFKENLNIISYSLYTYAQEPTSARGGSFIGSSILYTSLIADENLTVKLLNEYHTSIENKYVINEVISVNHSDKLKVLPPKDFDKIEFHLNEINNINFLQNSSKTLVVYCKTSPDELQTYLKKSLDLLNVYDTIYFTDSQEVAEFVHQKGIFKLIQNVEEKRDFEKEINNLIEEKKRKREQSISEFEREVQRINEDKNRTIQEFKTQIEQSERTHFENERRLKESKEDVIRIGQFYEDFLNKTRSLINQLRHNNGNLEELKQIHNNNKVLFKNGVGELKRPNYTTTISKPKPKSNLHTEHKPLDFENKSSQRAKSYEERNEKSYKINKFKVASFVLSFLLLISWIYILFFKSNSEVDQSYSQNSTETVQINELKPTPNSELNKNDYTIVAKSITNKSSIEEVIKIIFEKNPTEIKSNYTGQEDFYSKQLIKLNGQCFEEIDGTYYFTKDTIRHIPTFKKQL